MTAAAAILLAVCIAGMAFGIWHQRRAAVRLWRQYPLPWLAGVLAIWRAFFGKEGK